LSHIEEWGPTDEQIAAQPALADERQRLPFLIIAARTFADSPLEENGFELLVPD
jgi:hypothetical protein